MHLGSRKTASHLVVSPVYIDSLCRVGMVGVGENWSLNFSRWRVRRWRGRIFCDFLRFWATSMAQVLGDGGGESFFCRFCVRR